MKSAKMVKNRRELVTPRKRVSLTKSRGITKVVTRPASATNNVVPATAANVKVVVRVRPPNGKEQDENFRTVVKVVDDQLLVFDPKEDAQAFFFHGVQQKGRDLLKKSNKDLKFMFDKVFSTAATTEEVFMDTTQSLINSLMEGCNCSVFAYGATGAGKTFTMTGTSQKPGITFLTMTELFKKREELNIEREFELGITYLEIYNELVKDLLNPGPALNLREDAKYGVTVAGIKMHKITKPDELFSLLEQGNRNRTQHPTDANAESSRSHAVFQVYIQMTLKGTNEIRRAKLSMIDLAGSERGSATGYVGARFTEGANINKSLLALGNCINSLADGLRHVPYRDSKLTRLLKDSLGGNCQTVMIANVSPSSFSYEDTYNTLKYAIRAKKIKTNIQRNVVNVDMHVGHYVKMLDDLKKENTMLKRQLEEEKNKNRIEDELKTECDRLRKRLEEMHDYGSIYTNTQILDEIKVLIEEKKTYIDRQFQLEKNENGTFIRRFLKEGVDSRLKSIMPNTPEEEEAHKKIGMSVNRFKKQQTALKEDLEAVMQSKQEIDKKLYQIVDKHPEIKNHVNSLQNELEMMEIKYRYEILERTRDLLLDDQTEKCALLEQMATVLKSCYLRLKGHGYASPALAKQYQEVVLAFQGKRNIKWGDVPDSGVSSTTSIFTEGEEESKENANKPNLLEGLDGTFTLSDTTPNKPKTKIPADQIMAKVFKAPCNKKPKRLGGGIISPKSPKNKENLPSRRPLTVTDSLAIIRGATARVNTGLKVKPKTPSKPHAFLRPYFKS